MVIILNVVIMVYRHDKAVYYGVYGYYGNCGKWRGYRGTVLFPYLVVNRVIAKTISIMGIIIILLITTFKKP